MLKCKEPVNSDTLLVSQQCRYNMHSKRDLKYTYAKTNITLFQENIYKTLSEYSHSYEQHLRELSKMQSYNNIETFKLGQISKEKRGGYKHNQTAIFCTLPYDLLLFNNPKI